MLLDNFPTDRLPTLKELINFVESIIYDYLQTSGMSFKEIEVASAIIWGRICLDLAWLSSNDQASPGVYFTGNTYKSAEAIIYYRIYNYIFYENKISKEQRELIARGLSEDAKVSTGIEIHPGAKILEPFAIDHGYSTVIGETTEIGHHCTILNGVTLGAREVQNPIGIGAKRHPTILNYVTICAYARVYGPVTVGDKCFIGPFTTIINDLPSHTSVKLIDQQQVSNTNKSSVYIECITCDDKHRGVFTLRGKNIDFDEISVISYYGERYAECAQTDSVGISRNIVTFFICQFQMDVLEKYTRESGLGLKLSKNDRDTFFLPYSLTLTESFKCYLSRGVWHD